MKQGDKFIRLVMILLAAAVLAYFGYAVYGYLSAPISTVTALEYEASIGASASGYVVRAETPLSSTLPITVPTLAEGERVGKGQTVAVSYQSADAQQRTSEIANLQLQISELTYACSDSTDLTALDGEISDLLTSYQMRSARHQATANDTTSMELRGLLLRSGASGDGLSVLKTELSSLQEQLTALTSQADSGSSELTASVPGYFSGSADGYETVLTKDALDNMTCAEYDALPDAAEAVGGQVYGKLITSDIWYFVTELTPDKLAGVEAGDLVTLTFSRDSALSIPMQVSRIGAEESGKCLLVLSTDTYIQDVTLLREQTCRLIFKTYSGLRVPKKAIHVDESGQAGVYVLEGAVARWKPVEILYAVSENYVVKLDESSTGNLWPGDEILLGSGLSDGKVVNTK